MKILTENGLYIQKSDLILLQNTKIGIPLKVQKDINKNNISESNPNEFIRFTKEETINYFKDQEWIVDYKLVNAMSHEQIIRIYKVLKDKINILNHRIFLAKNADLTLLNILYLERELLNHKLKDILKIIQLKNEGLIISLDEYENKGGIKRIFKKGN